MSLRFLFDECADEDVARALIAQGVDVVSVSSLGRKGLPDEAQFGYAQHDNRVLYSTDNDYFRLAAEYNQRGQTHAGIVYHRQGKLTKRQIIDALILLNAVYEMADLLDRIEYL
jgi:predicted nuclease of predicted toxin-antitoxin system